MKKTIIAICMAFLALNASAQQAKVAVEKKTGKVSRLISVNKDKLHIEAQDDAWVNAKDYEVKLFSAEYGDGYVHLKKVGIMYLNIKPKLKSKVVGHIESVDGELPEVAKCLGKVKGFYKVCTDDGKIGYLSADPIQTAWNAINPF